MNKKRLAALTLSAVMAASTMSFPVYAADFSDGATAGAEVQVQSDFASDAAGSAECRKFRLQNLLKRQFRL